MILIFLINIFLLYNLSNIFIFCSDSYVSVLCPEGYAVVAQECFLFNNFTITDGENIIATTKIRTNYGASQLFISPILR